MEITSVNQLKPEAAKRITEICVRAYLRGMAQLAAAAEQAQVEVARPIEKDNAGDVVA